MNWDDIRYFLAIGHEGSLSAAARKLKVNRTTVFRRIRALEKALKLQLFEPDPSGYVLTIAGEEMYAAALEVEERVAKFERTAVRQDSRVQRAVRVAAPE